MNHTEKVFLEAYSCALQGTRCNRLRELSGSELREVFRLADSHRVFPMILQSMYPEGAGKDASGYVQKSIQKAESLTCGQALMSAEFLKLYRFLRKRNLSPIVMKGIICRSLYPEPEQRSSSDEDLLIPEEMFRAYHKALTEYGLKLAELEKDIYKEHEVPYCSSQVYIELHKKPFPPDSKAYGDLNRFFTDVWERTIRLQIYGVSVTTMSYTDHLFYQLCHAYKHFLNCGIGIRLVSDIILFSVKYGEQIDWELVTNRCREIHAYDFASALYRIGAKHLLPECFPKILKDVWQTENIDERELLSDILEGGVYGTSSEDRLHSSNLTLGAMENARTGSFSPVLLRTLFPSFNSMRGRYPYLEKIPFLLPAAWGHRLFTYARDNAKNGRGSNQASEAVRIGNERVALMRRYRILEETEKKGSPLKRLYKWTHRSVLAPVISPVYTVVSMAEFYGLNLLWLLRGEKMPNKAEKRLVRENVTFIAKSFERQHLAKGLCRNISRMYPGTAVIIADDSRQPLEIGLSNVKVVHLPFNSGLGAGLHEALEEVKTPYIVRLDDDELLTIRSKVHRELRYLMRQPELDLIGFGHTTAIRLHSPEFNFKEYYKASMDDALRPLKIPHLTKIDKKHVVLGKVANIYLARTDKLREVGFDPKIRVIDHHEFFWRAAGVITSAVALDTVVFHRHNPYEKAYNAFRNDYAADLEYITTKRNKMIQEAKRKNYEKSKESDE